MSTQNGNGHKPETNGHKPAKSKQVKSANKSVKAEQLEKVDTPGQKLMKRKLASFLTALRDKGIVSEALKAAKLNRKTAYTYLKTDQAFADEWMEALEVSNDGLYTEARRRAIDGSDTLLIFLIRQGEANKKWRTRIIKAGQLAVNTIAEEGRKAGVTEEQIAQIQNAVVDRLSEISLI